MNSAIATGLSEQEQKLLYNCEVLKMTQQRAAELAGYPSFPAAIMKRPDMLAAREQLRNMVRVRVNITKEDVINGIQKAIEHAVLLDDPMAQIAGWRDISKMLGYDAPREINITVSGAVRDVRRQVSQLGDEELVALLGADNVVDAEFYPVSTDG